MNKEATFLFGKLEFNLE
jgi:hypothetical protein